MRVLVLHDELPPDARADEADILDQARAVERALADLGHAAERLPFSLDLASLAGDLARRRPDLVFNLVESPLRTGRLIHLAPALLDALRIAYTGSSTDAVFTTSSKVLAKRLLALASLPTPPWIELALAAAPDPPFVPGRYIIKSVWEHASIGLDDSSLVDPGSPDDARRAILARRDSLGGDALAERFVEGREFNLSLLDSRAGPVVLPPAEIEFHGFAPSRPRIVGYSAKWDPGSPESLGTPRRFDFPASDAPLLQCLRTLALRCWSLFRLRGYARVDFRVDRRGEPWILEINTNPCLSPDAGFAAAAERGGLGLRGAVARIVESAAS